MNPELLNLTRRLTTARNDTDSKRCNFVSYAGQLPGERTRLYKIYEAAANFEYVVSQAYWNHWRTVLSQKEQAA